MRLWPVVALLAAGCSIQLGTTGTAPGVKSSPKAASTTPFLGVWTKADDPDVKGPLHQDPCAKYRRYLFGPSKIEVTDANAGFTGFYFNTESLTLVAGSGANHFQLVGTYSTPGPTDGPVARPLTYDLVYDPDRQVFKGKYTWDGGTKDVVLVKTDAPTTAPACASPTPSAPLVNNTALGYVVKVGFSGGLCPEPGCGWEDTFRADGSYTRKRGQTATDGQVDAGLVQAVQQALATADFAAIKAKKYQGLCATAVDGSETTYTFAALDGEQVIPGCTYAVDPKDPLFAAADKLEAATTRP
jgi:hypothetical protein